MQVIVMLTYILEHKEWIFSGIGIAIITGLFAFVRYVVKYITLRCHLKNVDSKMFSYALNKDEFFPEFDILEPNQQFLLNCSIKTHSLLLNKLKKSIRIGDSLIWIDVDSFSQINKCFGTEIGDDVIHTVLMIIASTIKKFNIDVRVFHANKRDEFYIVGKTEVLAEYIIRVLITAIQRYNWSNLVPNLFVTCSAGIAFYNNNPVDTLRRARISLNMIKAKGGNGIGPQIIKLQPHSLIDLNMS